MEYDDGIILSPPDSRTPLGKKRKTLIHHRKAPKIPLHAGDTHRGAGRQKIPDSKGDNRKIPERKI